MGRWLLRRLIVTLITFIGFTVIVFTLMRLSPVSPVDLMLFNLRQQGGLSAVDMQRTQELDLPPLSTGTRYLTTVTDYSERTRILALDGERLALDDGLFVQHGPTVHRHGR